jgi:hypothetical protein
MHLTFSKQIGDSEGQPLRRKVKRIRTERIEANENAVHKYFLDSSNTHNNDIETYEDVKTLLS